LRRLFGFLMNWHESEKIQIANTDKIPGQLSTKEKEAIALIAHLVPRSGTVVEVGSLLGLSSWL